MDITRSPDAVLLAVVVVDSADYITNLWAIGVWCSYFIHNDFKRHSEAITGFTRAVAIGVSSGSQCMITSCDDPSMEALAIIAEERIGRIPLDLGHIFVQLENNTACIAADVGSDIEV